MRTVWSCSSCAFLLLFALLSRETSASHVARQWKHVHRIPKAQVTAAALRRDEGTCPAEHTSCAASLNGGCCPSRYACAVDSCYATTAGPTTACNKAGYYACAAVDGGGCCPVGYVCGKGAACIPPAGVSDTYLQCPTGYFLCPSTLNYGCCKNGMGCARSACYSTVPVTTTITQTVTTTSGSETITTTGTAVTVATPSPPSGLPTDGTDVAAKFIPTSVPKVPASSPTSDSSGGGLSGGAIGGIIAGVVVLLIVVVVAAFLIIRRLKHVEEVMESKQGTSSGKKSRGQSHAQMEHYGRQLHSDMDDMSVDPLMTSSNTHNNSSVAGTPRPGADAARTRSDSAGPTPSPNMFHNPHAPYVSPDSNMGYFDIVPGSGAAAFSQQQQQQQEQHQQPQGTTHVRGSIDSVVTASAQQQQQQQHRGYAHHRHHWRQQSNASELSADGSDSGAGASVLSPLVGGAGGGRGAHVSGPAELDASGAYAELPDLQSNVGAGAAAGTGADAGVRSRSSSTASARGHGGYGYGYGYGHTHAHGHGYGHARRRSDGLHGTDQQGQSQGQGQGLGPAVAPPGQGLTPLDEAAEQAQMHGYYGGRNQQAGQTAAGGRKGIEGNKANKGNKVNKGNKIPKGRSPGMAGCESLGYPIMIGRGPWKR